MTKIYPENNLAMCVRFCWNLLYWFSMGLWRLCSGWNPRTLKSKIADAPKLLILNHC